MFYYYWVTNGPSWTEAQAMQQLLLYSKSFRDITCIDLIMKQDQEKFVNDL